MPKSTIAEKILAKASGTDKVKPNEIVTARVDIAMSHENADVVRKGFKEIGKEKVWDPDKIVIILDHRIPAETEKTATSHKAIREFVHAQDIKNFYDIGRGGICHQILPDKGHVWPGQVLVGTDSHTTTHGAFGSFSTGIGATEMAGVWCEGELWFKVPTTLKIVINGRPGKHISSKDIILYIIGKLGADGADYRSVEFCGSTVDAMSIPSRMVMTNLSMEMGAKVAFTPVDKKLIKYLKERTNHPLDDKLAPDKDAEYERVIEIDMNKDITEPQIACPHTVENVKPISQVTGIKINQAVVGSCTNGRMEDLKIAAKVVKGKKIHPNVRLIIIPASQDIYLQAMQKGYLKSFIEAGAIINPPGCGPCLGAHQGLLAAGEVAIASTNRNFAGRMGSKDAEVYLASPEVVAASALVGKIICPSKI